MGGHGIEMKLPMLLFGLVACGSRSGLDVSDLDAGDGALFSDVAMVEGGGSDTSIVVGGCSHLVLTESIQSTRLAFDATYVYFADATGASIRRVPKSGGAVEVIANDVVNLPYVISNLVVDHEFLYWSSPTNSELHRVPKSGGLVTTIPCIITRPSYTGPQTTACSKKGAGSLPIAIVGTNAILGSLGEILRLPLGGGEATVVDSFNAGAFDVNSGVFRLAVRDNRVYWLAGGVLFTRPLNTTPEARLAGAAAFAVDSKYAYYSSGSNIALVAIDGSGVPLQLVSGLFTNEMDGDDRFVYWFGDHTIRKTSKDDAVTTTLETWTSVGSILQVDDCVYYVGAGPSVSNQGLIRTEK